MCDDRCFTSSEYVLANNGLEYRIVSMTEDRRRSAESIARQKVLKTSQDRDRLVEHESFVSVRSRAPLTSALLTV